MEPYTAAGLAKSDGFVIQDEDDIIREVEDASGMKPPIGDGPTASSHYRTVGIVVHFWPGDGWDTTIPYSGSTKDDELKTQCFGEESPVPVANSFPEYFAFLRALLVNSSLYLPRPRRSIDQAERNLQHLRHQASAQTGKSAGTERAAAAADGPHATGNTICAVSSHREEIDACCLAVVQLMGKFMFDVCFRTRRNLRGPAHEWSEALSKLLVQSASARHFFTEHVLFKHSKRMVEFLLECPNQDVRNGFARILAHVASHGHGDRPCPPSAIRAANLVGYHFPTEPESLEDLIILACMSLTQRKDFSDHSRQISNFFQLFNLINSGGLDQVRTLIRLGLPELLIRIAIDEVPYSLFKYNAHHELGKLFSLVCTLVLHIDFSDTRSTSETDPEGGFIAPNPFALEQPSHVPASRELCDLFLLNSNFTKKLVEDGLQLEEVRTALKYLCWENQPFTVRVIYAILGVLSQQYPSGDLRVLLDFAFTFIQMNDSLLCFRLVTFFHGVPSDSAEGLLANIHRNQTSHPRRAYLCFKFTLTMLSIDNMGYFLQPQSKDTNEFKTVFIETCEWLERELSSSGGRSGGYYNGPRNYYNSNFNSWNHNIVISNESSNGIHLERSDSVRNLLDRAYEYYPVEPNGDTALPTISATIDGDEEEDDDSAVTFSAADSTNPGDLDDDLEAAPRSRGGATDTWRSSSGDIYGRRGGGAGESLTGLGGPSSSCAASSSGAGRPMFGSGRRNASVQDVMKGNLISSGIFPAAATRGDALDPEQDDVLDDMETLDTADHRDSGKISECLQGLQLSGGGAASRSGAGSDTTDPFAMESYRPGTPQEGTAEEFFGFCPK
ncbi:putative ubiquitin carboxyl-terminal hydrolase FAF-X [Hypsibius exemplaris]|uniref:Ubiquitin carboxyl-terminal hydrolase FAF-X n=1 Tax=Hypsibius exemplaris TaxID=2072580 RepID=A0A1W0X1Y3_HYPEX|nr:putative ubiquitin carboxyl-terminal hydrolase FAF-X [Hypsibius exemplaris]